MGQRLLQSASLDTQLVRESLDVQGLQLAAILRLSFDLLCEKRLGVPHAH